jgi:hypothetical protein
VHVPTERLHLVSVDVDGAARLKPRLGTRSIVNSVLCELTPASTYDASPEIEELFRKAPPGHQLERAYLREAPCCHTEAARGRS